MTDLTVDQIFAVTAAVAVVVCGLLPWYALSASGLTGLDDQVLAGRPGRRDHVLATVDVAYRSLSWAAVAVALPLGPGGRPGWSAPRAPWAVVLGVTVIVLIALRTRAFPLIVQQLPLCLAAIGATLVAVLALEPRVGTTGVAGLLIGFALLTAVGAGARPAEHQRARLRRLGNFVEAVGMIGADPPGARRLRRVRRPDRGVPLTGPGWSTALRAVFGSVGGAAHELIAADTGAAVGAAAEPTDRGGRRGRWLRGRRRWRPR